MVHFEFYDLPPEAKVACLQHEMAAKALGMNAGANEMVHCLP